MREYMREKRARSNEAPLTDELTELTMLAPSTEVAPPDPDPEVDKSESRAREHGEGEQQQPTKAGVICKALVSAGIAHVNPSHPRVLKLIEAGVDATEFADAAREAIAARKGTLAYVCGMIEGRRRDAASGVFQKKTPVPACREVYVAKGPRRREGPDKGPERIAAILQSLESPSP
jgi:hypothetical protein